MERKWAGGAAAGAGLVGIIVVLLMLPAGGTGISLADAADRMQGESTRIELNMGITDSSGSYSVTGEAITTADNARGTAELTITMQGEPERIRMLVRNVGDDFWYRYPQVDDLVGRKWVHEVDQAMPAQSLTPSELTSFLTNADDVHERGKARIRGKDTTHYEGWVDVEEMGDEIGGETKERIEAAIEQATPKDGQKVGLPIEAWIAEDGLPVRLRIWCGDGENSFDVTADILEYGVPVDVEPPPADKIIEQDEFERLTA